MAALDEVNSHFLIEGEPSSKRALIDSLVKCILEADSSTDLQLQFAHHKVNGNISVSIDDTIRLETCPITQLFISPSQNIRDVLLVLSDNIDVSEDSFDTCSRIMLSDHHNLLKQHASKFLSENFGAYKSRWKELPCVVEQFFDWANTDDPTVKHRVIKMIMEVAKDPEFPHFDVSVLSISPMLECIVEHGNPDTTSTVVLALYHLAKQSDTNKVHIAQSDTLQRLVNLLGYAGLWRNASMLIHELCLLQCNRDKALLCDVQHPIERGAIFSLLSHLDPSHTSALLLLMRAKEGACQVAGERSTRFHNLMEALVLESSMPVWDLVLLSMRQLWESFPRIGSTPGPRTAAMQTVLLRIIADGTDEIRPDAESLFWRIEFGSS